MILFLIQFNYEELKSANVLKFSNNDINKFIFLLGKGVYPYEIMDKWEKVNETSFPEKEEFHSNLKMEDITDIMQITYMQKKSVKTLK